MKNQHNLPIYLYACRYKRGNRVRFGGELYFGRLPTIQEERSARFWAQGYTHFLRLKSQHHIDGIYPDLEVELKRSPRRQCNSEFYSLDELFSCAKDIYTERGYTSGLIIRWDVQNPPADKVLILPDNCYSEKEFLERAQELHLWKDEV